MPPSRSLLALLLATCVVRCGVALEVPADVDVTCKDDHGCPNGTRCSKAHLCIPADDPDESPMLLAASATDHTTVTLSFSKPMRTDLLAAPTAYRLDFEASVIAVDVALDGTSVRLATSEQRGRTYTVSVLGATDLFGRPLEGNTATFQGVGRPIDTAVPRTVSPLELARLRGPTIDLVWTQNIDAQSYHVELARDAGMQDIVISQDVDAASTATQVELDTPGQYYWRVTSDATPESSGVARFVVLTDAVYVACTGLASSCSAAIDTQLGGDRAEPLTTIGSALALARTLGIGIVRAAANIDAAAYRDALSIVSQKVDFQGGYDATFDHVAGSTSISSLDGPCLVYASEGVRLSNVTCRGADTAAGGIFHAVGSQVTLDHVDIMATMPTQAIAVDDSQVVMEGCNVRGTEFTTSVNVLSGSALVARDTHFENNALDLLGASDLTLERSTMLNIAVGDDTVRDSAIDGVRASASSHVILNETRIVIGVPDSGTSYSLIGIDVTDTVLLDIRRSLIYAGVSLGVSHCSGTPEDCRSTSSAIRAAASVSGVVQNSVLVAGGVLDGGAIDVRDAGVDLSVIHSTLVGLVSSKVVQNGVFDDGFDGVDLVDCALICEATDTTVPAGAIQPTLPRTLVSNAFVGCPVAFRQVTPLDSVDMTNASQLDMPGPPHYAGNFSVSETLALFFAGIAGVDGITGTLDDDFATLGAGAASLAHAGTPSASATCGVMELPCEATAVDFAGQVRAVPPSIGATELP